MNPRTLVLTALALLAFGARATAAQPFRLFEISVIRFIKDANGTLILDQGIYNALGEYRPHRFPVQLAPGTVVPPDAMNRPLLPISSWLPYEALGAEALANFDLTHGLSVDDATYFAVGVAEHPRLDVGTIQNLSTRGGVAPGGEPLIGGFVIDERPRRVLIRGIGPALADFNVAAPLANPVIRIFRAGETAAVAANDDWGQQTNAADIEAAATSAGAFALKRISKDAALLIELPPGVYTAHLSSADSTGGTALLEIYTLP